MKSPSAVRLVATTKTLRITLTVSVGGGPHRSTTYSVPLDALEDLDVVTLGKALDGEIMRRIRAGTLAQDVPLF